MFPILDCSKDGEITTTHLLGFDDQKAAELAKTGTSLPVAANRIKGRGGEAKDDEIEEMIKKLPSYLHYNYWRLQLLTLLLLPDTVDSDATELFLPEEYKRNILPNLHMILKNFIQS